MKKTFILFILVVLAFSACKRDEYYRDGGKAQAEFNGSMLEYLQSKPVLFDTIAQIVKLAGMEGNFSDEDFTFFAPDDETIKRTIGTIYTFGLNSFLYYAGKDTVKTLANIDSLIWKKYLQRYMFRGSNRLKDYPQVDFNLVTVFPGALYFSYAGNVSNIGVEYGDVNGIKYIGYRQLALSYIPDISKPNDNWRRFYISSSDIKPTNGVVHTLRSSGAYFGFDEYEFFNEIYITGLK
jgi:hypothetical protein